MNAPQAPQQDTPLTVNPTPLQVDTPLTVTPSPMNMPGARNAMNAPVETMTPPTATPTPTPEPKPPESEPATSPSMSQRLKAAQDVADAAAKLAQENLGDAELYRQLRKQFTSNGDTPPDPIAEVNRLRQEIQAERIETTRERVARETGVPPSQVHGSDEASMKAAAEQALAWAKSLQQSPSNVPAAAPAATVNSATPTHQTGTQQIQSRDELKNMSPKEIVEAYENGRMDFLQGKTPQH